MAVVTLRVSFPSLALLRPVEIVGALPPPYATVCAPYRTVWLLHCAMEGGQFFFDSLDVASLVEQYGVAVFAPSLGNGYFINSPYERQADFLEEMKDGLAEMFRLSPARGDNAVIGVSMGAFGALRWALAGDSFHGAAAISGVFDCHIPLDERVKKDRALKALCSSFDKVMRSRLLDAEGATRPEADFSLLLGKRATEAPRLAFYCGKDDYLAWPHTMALERLAAEAGCKTTLHLDPGSHDKQYWRRALQESFNELLKTQ